MCAGRPRLLFFVKSYALRAIIRVRLLHLDYPAHLWLEKQIKSVAELKERKIRGAKVLRM
jgi:hypothetical protein